MPYKIADFNHEHKINHIMVGAIIALMLVLGVGLIFAMQYHPGMRPAWRIAITNWPGFDYLYLADKKGFFKQNGLNIQLIPINSMTDMRTAYERSIIDGYTGTVMDVADSLQDNRTDSRIVLVTDYSTGGDQLLADPSITTIADLKGKRFGVEVTSSLERYLMLRALEGSGITLADLDIRPYSQTVMVELTLDHTLDGLMTYEPYASKVQANRPMRILFDSSSIPQEVVDVLVVSDNMLTSEKDLSQRLQLAWQSAVDYANAHPDETNAILAQRYGISMDEYKALNSQYIFFTRNSMQRFTSSHALHQLLHRVTKVLNPAKTVSQASVSSSIAVWYQQEAQ